MEDLLTNAFNTGDIKIVIAALVVYCIIYFQRKQTSTKRDTDHDTIQTRVTLLEHDCELVKSQMETVSTKLDKICDLLTSIQIELAKKADKD